MHVIYSHAYRYTSTIHLLSAALNTLSQYYNGYLVTSTCTMQFVFFHPPKKAGLLVTVDSGEDAEFQITNLRSDVLHPFKQRAVCVKYHNIHPLV